MTSSFRSVANPSGEDCSVLEGLAPFNPFNTAQYLDAVRRQQYEPWVLSIADSDETSAGCIAMAKSGKLNTWLQIDSLPELKTAEQRRVFWVGLGQFCGQAGVSVLQLNSFASKSASIPPFENEVWRKRRYEFVLHLADRELWPALSSNHRRNIKRARKSSIEIRRSGSESACRVHMSLIGRSQERRRKRGESVVELEGVAPCLALVQSGAGELYQALNGETVVSSILLLKSRRGAYYHSAGTHPDGMALGASHLLLHDCCLQLQDESKDVFNLGGVSELDSGLARFKGGFGAEPRELESMEARLGRTLRSAIARLANAFSA